MTTYNTGNPIGSIDPRDLLDNAQNLDVAVNDRTATTWTDRLGNTRKTLNGVQVEMEAEADQLIEQAETAYNNALQNLQAQSTANTAALNAKYDADVDQLQNIYEIALQDLKTFTLRGEWATATAYEAKDLVTSGGTTYLVMEPHTSGVLLDDLASGKLAVYQGLTDATVGESVRAIDKSIDAPITAKNVLFVGDSLTELRSGTSYARTLVKSLSSAAGGYKDVGYIPFSTYQTKDLEYFGAAFSRSANMINMWGASDRKWDELPYTYSPDGKGLHSTAGAGDFVSINFSKPAGYTKIRLFYLQQPGGGTFNFHFVNTPTVDRINVDSDGVLELKWVDMPAASTFGSNIRVTAIVGKVALYGVQLINESADDAGKFSYTVWARNGIKLQDFLNLSATPAYVASVLPDLVIINIGTNDCNAQVSAAQFRTGLETFIARVKAGSPNAQIVLMEPNRPAYYFTANGDFQGYTAQRRDLATTAGYGLIDLPSLVGDYAEMAPKMEDTTHPNGAGKVLIAQKAAEYIERNVQNIVVPFSAMSDVVAAKPLIPRQAYGVTVAQGTPVILKEFGLIGDYNTVDVELYIRAGLYGGALTKKVQFVLRKDNVVVSGKVQSVVGLTSETYRNNLTSTPEIVPAVTINAEGHAEVSFTHSGFNLSYWSVWGEAFASRTGDTVVEYI